MICKLSYQACRSLHCNDLLAARFSATLGCPLQPIARQWFVLLIASLMLQISLSSSVIKCFLNY